jgi:predicted molibdopterin-dependent oxidoreductase YjgC
MFRFRFDSAPATIAVIVEGAVVHVPAGASAAAALLAASLCRTRETSVSGEPRAPYCMMGVCYECLAEIDGVPNQQSCMIEARTGMHVHRQARARQIAPGLAFPDE